MLAGRVRQSTTRAFTRVEAVVVLVGVLLLAAVLLVLGRQSRDGPGYHATACANNLRQCGLAMIMYATSNKGLFPLASSSGERGWVGTVLQSTGMREARTVKDANELPLAKADILHCPVRAGLQVGAFVDYLSNAMNPAGPDATGAWPASDARKLVAGDSYRRPMEVVLLIEAEREDRVVDFKDLPSVKAARDQWNAGPSGWKQGGVHAMTVWKGGHLPQGRNGINVDDKPGPRKVARAMHLSGHINATFLDGHVERLRRKTQLSETEDYGYWLRLFGVKDPQKVAESDDDLY